MIKLLKILLPSKTNCWRSNSTSRNKHCLSNNGCRLFSHEYNSSHWTGKIAWRDRLRTTDTSTRILCPYLAKRMFCKSEQNEAICVLCMRVTSGRKMGVYLGQTFNLVVFTFWCRWRGFCKWMATLHIVNNIPIDIICLDTIVLRLVDKV